MRSRKADAAGAATGGHYLLIRPSRGWSSLGLRDVWKYRELLYFLIWRDVKIRYKQTVLGASWAILQPLLTMVVFTIFFGGLAKVGSDGLPYPIFSFAGLLPWTFFAQGLGQSSNSVVGSSGLITKVYFPRLVIPISSVLGGLVDFAIAFVVLIAMMAYYGIWPSLAVVLWLPLLLLLATATSLGVGLWLSALSVEYRDVRFVVPFFVQLWLFVTPVIYPASKVVGELNRRGLPTWLYGLNPMAGVVEGFRWALLGTGSLHTSVLIASAFVATLLLLSGAFYFRRMERGFADVI
jgi:lipopolysaccharide transport system permease protein